MKLSSYISIIALATSSALAAPTGLSKRQSTAPTNTQVLNYALTLEHLENAFYSTLLPTFSAADFKNAGFGDFVHGRITQIASHEAQHVQFLESALGSAATQPCTYSFGVTDVKSFVALAEILEGLGSAAYLGAAPYITDPKTLEAAGSIYGTEARHNAWINSAAEHEFPWSGGFETPLSMKEVFSLASPFITSCPSTNPPLGLVPFNTLTLSHSTAIAGQTVQVTTNASQSPLWIAFFSGLQTQFVAVINGLVTIPSTLEGTVYAVATTIGSGTVTDDNTVAGPVILLVDFAPDAPN